MGPRSDVDSPCSWPMGRVINAGIPAFDTRVRIGASKAISIDAYAPGHPFAWLRPLLKCSRYVKLFIEGFDRGVELIEVHIRRNYVMVYHKKRGIQFRSWPTQYIRPSRALGCRRFCLAGTEETVVCGFGVIRISRQCPYPMDFEVLTAIFFLSVIQSAPLQDDELVSDARNPAPEPGMMPCRVAAVAGNQFDAQTIDYSPSHGSIGWCDFAGEVVEMGEDLTRFKKGDRVFGLAFGINPQDIATGVTLQNTP
ncbi:hypothetical protein GGR54DRAFT_643528 [Hypoxylon sp. NC1633]|nr:hypothetical protein GGR54DRAFT_643528 [Hypoxylon sp. NC1633]